MKMAVVQMNSKDNKEKNVQTALDFIDSAAKDGADFVSLPEYFNFLGDKTKKLAQAESIPGPTSQALTEKAKEHGIYIHSGSFLEKYDDKRFNVILPSSNDSFKRPKIKLASVFVGSVPPKS